MRRAVVWIGLGAALSWAAPARAGALGEVVKGLTRAAGDSGHKSGGGGGEDAGDVVSEVVGALLDGPDYSSSRAANDPVWVASPGTYYAPPAASGHRPMDLEIYAGVQSVDDSDGSMTLELRATYESFGVVLRGSGYYERTTVGKDVEHVHLDLGSFGGTFRVFQDDEDHTRLWLEGGLGGVSTVDGLDFIGWYAGARLDRKLQGELGISAEARHFSLEDDVTANELRASAHISLLRISYRILDFNVGPPLKGPEVGIALIF